MAEHFHSKLVELLKKDIRFVDEESGELIRSEIVNETLKIDKKLIESLLSEKDIKEKFFTQIKGHWIFEMNKFIDYIQDKNFLSDSYTKFKNKIGLNLNGKFLNERNEVALVWPFKDCILEGGMTKEDEKRNEIFFNEILAQDEIDRLLDPKVLTNFKRYTTKGEEKIVDFKRDKEGIIKDNLIIKGNNLLALHSLRKEFQGKIKLIYIDPPYNRDADSFYNDNFKRSSWLTFMKSRLEVAKELLKIDGAIFIQIDDSQAPYLKVICDEIFGEENNPVILYIQVRYGQKTLSEKNDFQKVIEQVFVYANKGFKPIKEKEEYTLDNFVWKIIEKKSGHKLKLGSREAIMFKPGEYEIKEEKSSLKGLKQTWASGTVLKANASGKFFNDFIAERVSIDGLGCLYKVEGIGEDGLGYRYFTGPKREGATKGIFYSGVPLDRVEQLKLGTAEKEIVIPNFYDFAADFGNCRQEGGVELRSGKKPEVLLKRIIDMVISNNDEVILDFFIGTGVTPAVAHKMGIRYIGIEQLDYGKDDAVIRLKNVIKGDQTGISKSVKWEGGGDFVYCELMKYNEEAVEKIQDAKPTENLLKIWKEMVEHYFLNYDVDIKRFNDNQEEFKKLSLENQKKLLIELLNKNQLYVNLSEIDDSQFKVSKEDKELNKNFYK
ncbi:MAG: site-specific DNA-methyltransferase [Nanoarchaeota archaeon]